MELGDLKNRIENLEMDLKRRIASECETIKEADNPREELHRYIKNIRWNSPELAAYLEKEMLTILNFDNASISEGIRPLCM